MKNIMPFGRCVGCGDETHLPPLGDGMCFLCAVDGPPGSREQTFGALHEDGVRSDPTIDWFDCEDRQREVAELFEEQQFRFARAIGADHYRAQRFKTGTRATRYHREPVPSDLGPTAAQLAARVRRKQKQQAPIAYAAAMADSKSRRNGGGHYLCDDAIARVRELRAQGRSIREIARETGVSRDTVMKYAQWVDRSDAMERKHARWRAEGMPVLPPWRKRTKAA